MPLTRYQIRNEYGLADPELYGAADRDDPEALLEGVAMAGLVGVLRQLGDLAEWASFFFLLFLCGFFYFNCVENRGLDQNAEPLGFDFWTFGVDDWIESRTLFRIFGADLDCITWLTASLIYLLHCVAV